MTSRSFGQQVSSHKMNASSNYSCSANLFGITKTLFVVMNSIFGLATVAGNGIVIVVICRTKLLRFQSNLFILSLTVGDFLVGLLINPLYIAIVLLNVWVEEDPLFKLENYLWIQSLTVTTFSLCSISIERYFAISRPFRYNQILTKRRCCFVIALLWLLSFIVGIASFLVEAESQGKLWVACSSLVVFVPLITMACFYFKIFQEVIRHKKRIKQDSVDVITARRKNQKAIKTIAIIVGVFMICFTPSLVFSFITMVQTDKCKELKIYRSWIWAIFINFSASTFNPWIYALRTRDFQRGFTRVFGCRFLTENGTKWRVILRLRQGEYAVNIQKSVTEFSQRKF